MFNLKVIGNIVLADKIIKGGSLLIQDGKIATIEAKSDAKAKQILNFEGCLILPGVVDEHVHSRSEPTKDIDDATKAAAVNVEIAFSISNRGYILENGKVVLSDSVEELKENDMVRKAYLGG